MTPRPSAPGGGGHAAWPPAAAWAPGPVTGRAASNSPGSPAVRAMTPKKGMSVTTFTTNIAFAGLTAAGKTTHARRLAAELGYDYVSATEILLGILGISGERDRVWFTQLDHINRARDGGSVDAELEQRLLGLCGTHQTSRYVLSRVIPDRIGHAYAKIGAPVLVDDTGLTLHAWNGLPGALVKWFLDTVGTHGILQMAAGVQDRSASVTTALGYADATGVRVYAGTVHGRLSTTERGDGGFGYDSIFIPDGSAQTFAEMTPQQKNAISHRRRAVDALREGLGIHQRPTA
jgi:XTP/dITP diphosphohydrolase